MSPFTGWEAVAEALRARAAAERSREPAAARLNAGQQAALEAIAGRLEGGHDNRHRGVIIADEVGMGKTRVATAVARTVLDNGGRVVVAVPPGLQYQWRRELEGDDLKAPPMVHTLDRARFAPPEDREAWRHGPLVLISHAFPNWRMQADANRWAILPLLVAHHAKAKDGRWPQGYHEWAPGISQDEVERASELYASLAGAGCAEARDWLDAEVKQPEPWKRRYHDAWRYHVGGDLRNHLERAVGLNLGRFNLVIVDEAHKARGESSGLSRLLGRVLHLTETPARLGLTATPLALDISEWSHSLLRVGVSGPERQSRDGHILRYKETTRALRDRWKTSDAEIHRWRRSARGFEQALRPFVLRRDKREDTQVQRFTRSPWGAHDYRHLRPTRIDPAELSASWREVVFAAEALSATSSGVRDPAAKRLRLTLANGHGVAAMVAEAHEDAAASHGVSTPDARRDARAAFWRGLIRTRAASEGETLFRHPHLLRAVQLIEEQDEAGQKVLVFGRFTKPMEVLVTLLNARARLRWMGRGDIEPWPEELAGQAFPAAEDLVAADQLNIDRSELPALLERHRERVRLYERDREWFRVNVLTLLTRAAALEGLPPGLASLLASARTEGQPDRDAALARALLDLMPPEARSRALARSESEAMLRDLARAAHLLLAAATDQDSTDEDDQPDEHEARQVWEAARALVDFDFATRRGGFARLLQGSTRFDTRRLLQAAFNRLHSFPRVLVAQSIVGREGLNLHEACRVILLLHPEWNPGVAEQQIGRVDRLGSRWARELDEAIAQGVPPERWPRIEVHSIVFGGTYDEHHWGVLERRWQDLRAQLHGEVIPTFHAGDDPSLRARAQSLNDDAPNFSPLPKGSG